MVHSGEQLIVLYPLATCHLKVKDSSNCLEPIYKG